MAGWPAGADRQSRLSGGPHPKDRNEEEEPGSARFAACRGGTRGERRPPRYSGAGGQRHRAPRDVRSPSQRKRCPAPAEPDKEGTLESGRPSRRRARGPVRQPSP